MYLISDRALKAIHEHRMAEAIKHRESAGLRRRPRRRLFELSFWSRPARPAAVVATPAERPT